MKKGYATIEPGPKKMRPIGEMTGEERADELRRLQTCQICGREYESVSSLHVDHDHRADKEKLRGWLCLNCNLGLGQFKDDPAILASAIRYLERSRMSPW